MQVYILSKNVPVDSSIVIACSMAETSLRQYRADHGDIRDEISLVDLPFTIEGLSEAWAVNCDIDSFNIFVDIGQYFRTREEAQSFVKDANEPYQIEKFRIESIKVI